MSKFTGNWARPFITTFHNTPPSPPVSPPPNPTDSEGPLLFFPPSKPTVLCFFRGPILQTLEHNNPQHRSHNPTSSTGTMKIQEYFSLQPTTRKAISSSNRNVKGEVHLQLGSNKTGSSPKKIKMDNSEWSIQDARGSWLIILNCRPVIHGVRPGLKVKNTD